MRMDRIAGVRRRATNVSLPEPLLSEAKSLGVNMSRACEEGLAREVKREREKRWLIENRDSIDEYNAWIEKNGLPLAHLRQF